MLDCLFCRIAAGEIKANMAHQNEHVVAFHDINPQAPIHILVIPRKHIENVASLTDADMGLVGEIHKVALVLAREKGLDKEGYRLLTNVGKNGGQTVNHLHYHLVGGRPMKWPPG